MIDDGNGDWEFSPSENNEWAFSPGMAHGPGMTLENLRDGALCMFDRYMCYRLKTKPREITEENIDCSRRFLTLEETESIIKEFSCHEEGMPDGMYAIGARSVEELMHKTRELLHALMSRIMSNVAHEGVNQGLLECAFDSEGGHFSFTPSKEGEKVIARLNEKKRKKKKKDDDSSD